MDVGVFGPVKCRYKEAIKEFNRNNPNVVINQGLFGKVLMPIYYEAVSKHNSEAGFKKCGLYPWDPDAPDYSKLHSRARQRDHPEGHLNDVVRSKKLF